MYVYGVYGGGWVGERLCMVCTGVGGWVSVCVWCVCGGGVKCVYVWGGERVCVYGVYLLLVYPRPQPDVR